MSPLQERSCVGNLAQKTKESTCYSNISSQVSRVLMSSNPTNPSPPATTGRCPTTSPTKALLFKAPPPETRIQVYWKIEHDSGDTVPLWWGATVKTTLTEFNEELNGFVTTLLYDENMGFGQSEEKVVFLNGEELIDIGRQEEEGDGLLNWRMECRAVEDEEEGELEGKECMRVEGGRVMTMEEVLLSQGEIDAEQNDGRSVVDLGMNAMSKLPFEKQMIMAQTYRNFAEHIKKRLKDIKDDHGEGYEISSRDIESIFKELGDKPPPRRSLVGDVI